MYFKSLFAAAASAALLMSCAKDTQIESALDTNNTIGFRSNMTRGTAMLQANLNQFWVTAVNETDPTQVYMLDQLFSKQPSSTFTSTPVYQWPQFGLQFFAYSPSKTDLGVGVAGKNAAIDWATKMLNNFVPDQNISQQVDFITANETVSAPTKNPVPLVFEHRLSQIEIMAKNTNSAYTYKVKGIRIARVKGRASFNFSTYDWTDDASKASYEVEYSSEITLGDQETSIMGATTGNAMLLPQMLTAWKTEQPTNDDDGAYLAVLIQISTNGNRFFPQNSNITHEWAAVPLSGEWKAGKKYTYILDFSNGAGKVDPSNPKDPDHPGEDILGDAITFTATVTDWKTDEGAGNQNLYMDGSPQIP